MRAWLEHVPAVALLRVLQAEKLVLVAHAPAHVHCHVRYREGFGLESAALSGFGPAALEGVVVVLGYVARRAGVCWLCRGGGGGGGGRGRRT